ncbi:MAG: penicillin-insensitive murein endopeptidase [Bdellovibrio sp.]|nr:penicillin-insensitive murein endopeptidase [Bdellovibrio sp.]
MYPTSFLINLLLLVNAAFAAPVPAALPTFSPCDPISEILGVEDSEDEPGPLFCSKWNPDFLFNGQKCCGKQPVRGSGRHRHRRISGCTPLKYRGNYCGEMTTEQVDYQKKVASGAITDVLSFLTLEMGRKGEQAYCSVNNGFLVNGRMIVPNAINRIEIRSPDRCLQFGTDPMVAMLEWLGREVDKTYVEEKYAGVKLVVGDISAPRGGCLLGRSGKRGHLSHTSGQDADLGFLTVNSNQKSPVEFHRSFDPKANWWMMKNIFKNPYACVRVIFLDRTHIRKLNKAVHSDPDWAQFQRFVRHMPGHRNHMHVRVGNGPGTAGCVPGAKPELEVEEDLDSEGFDEADSTANTILDELKARQSSGIQK